ncbi:cyclopropane-fatty-acyl-phospholipid synthase [Methylobacterium sp. BE186]|uniref:cyclopropane-fatty-acyl-phospholipid synthase family protein n=1 Tax=Methylobacterium sp. BE186 TaxID=2817715 RepID=UPI00285BD776|nr:cyclopropane-fatty-acyl-phospholipid synthase family protein [Methylobacterium sp. BE186]MDR7039236.1 cyclopropane-fatty-acyl-phospholipid synthase [Methylobacterium sp. BE186]
MSGLSGRLTVTTASGYRFDAGDGRGPEVAIRFRDAAAERAALLDPELRLGELFTDGRLTIEDGTLPDLMAVLLAANHGSPPFPPLRGHGLARALLRRLLDRNGPERARHNVARHYDLDGRLYGLFLDADWQYSCAYYAAPGIDLDAAQAAKKRHIAAKVMAGPGHRVLDIGCGWGGLGLYLAEVAGCATVRGITLSAEQHAAARGRALARGLEEQVQFALEDYRTVRGSFDRIVSVGMFEHVGPAHYGPFFQICRERLAEDGVMLLHTIGRTGRPAATNPWITRYIFPGGHLPTLSEMVPAIEASGLVVNDVEVLRLHYAATLRDWRTRFLARRAEAERLYDARFCRMWDWYLAAAEAAFRHEDAVVFQILLARRNDVVPATRDYIARAERRLRRREAALSPPHERAGGTGLTHYR